MIYCKQTQIGYLEPVVTITDLYAACICSFLLLYCKSAIISTAVEELCCLLPPVHRFWNWKHVLMFLDVQCPNCQQADKGVLYTTNVQGASFLHCCVVSFDILVSIPWFVLFLILFLFLLVLDLILSGFRLYPHVLRTDSTSVVTWYSSIHCCQEISAKQNIP
jgi:hypothetical protein